MMFFTILGQGERWWLGASDISVEGEWVWEVDQSPLSYTNWFEGEPNNDREQDCMEFKYQGGSPGWDDLDCASNEPHYICKYNLEKVTLL